MGAFFLLLIFLLSSVSVNAKPTVLVTIAPYAYFVKRMAGDLVQMEILVPPGSNPHIFEPTPKQVGEAGRAALWLRIEEPFEKKVLSVFKEQNQKLVTLNLLDNVVLLKDSHACCHEAVDRHVWLDPKIVMGQVKHIQSLLIAYYPDYKEAIVENTTRLLADLQALDKRLTARLSPYTNTTFLVSHPAFGYFARAYGLTQLSIEHEGKDPLPRQVVSMLQEVRARGVSRVITQPQYNNKGAELVANKLKLKIDSIDPYAFDYFGMMDRLAEVITAP